MYYEASLVSSNLNSKQLRFHSAHPSAHPNVGGTGNVNGMQIFFYLSKRNADFFFHFIVNRATP